MGNFHIRRGYSDFHCKRIKDSIYGCAMQVGFYAIIMSLFHILIQLTINKGKSEYMLCINKTFVLRYLLADCIKIFLRDSRHKNNI